MRCQGSNEPSGATTSAADKRSSRLSIESPRNGGPPPGSGQSGAGRARAVAAHLEGGRDRERRHGRDHEPHCAKRFADFLPSNVARKLIVLRWKSTI